jgi:hypothetical protein
MRRRYLELSVKLSISNGSMNSLGNKCENRPQERTFLFDENVHIYARIECLQFNHCIHTAKLFELVLILLMLSFPRGY